MALPDLRPYQVVALDQIDVAIADRTKTMVQAPTGAGKTVLAAAIADKIADAGKRMIFTVPALSLIDQTVKKLHRAGIWDVGVIQAKHPLTNHARSIQVASVQTLMRRQIPPADLVVIDEAHRWFDFYKRWMQDSAWAGVPFIGLSATPWTRGLGKHFDKLIIASTTQELIDAGHLSPFRVFAPASPDLSNVRTVAGDYHEGDLAEAMSPLIADVVDTWTSRGKGRPTLCFAVDRAHARHLQRRFLDVGVKAEYIDAYTDADERTAVEGRFHSGDVEVVCNVGCLTTGVDWDVRCIILARPTKSEMLFVQMIGRGLRTAEGKDDCLILDHSDNHLRLGFVTDIHHDKLDDGRERQKAQSKAKEVLPKKCPSCAFLKPPKTLVCPACGFAPKPKCDVEHKDGDLVEFVSRKIAKEPTEQDSRIFYAELRHLQDARGYKGGWAAHKFKDKYGSFPPWSWNDDELCTPMATTLSWVRSRLIAYARRATA